MEGDLADIFRATGRANGCSSDISESPDGMMNEEEYGSSFGDPFPFGSVIRDPFLVELDGIGGRAPASSSFHGSGGGDEMLGAATAPFQISTSSSSSSDLGIRMSGGFGAGAMPACSLQQGVRGGVGDHHATPCSPKPSHPQLLDAPRVQICSPTTPIAKRRKSQSKKVVCIPAPTTAANNRQGGGEVVPSDLWAWRKYGQKPIKGSPHPRGYYRCSSSKGCSARKQVERSRTDPNMLVITYTSEHNHPWPTQRNSLAGSTRIPSKPSPTPLPTTTEPHKPAGSIKDESDINSFAGDGDHSNSSSIGGADEVAEADGYYSKGLNDTVVGPDHQLMVLNDIMFDNTYDDNPFIQYSQQLDGYNWDHDLFADLRDMNAVAGDPLNLFFSGAKSGFSTADFDRGGGGGKSLMFDPFNNCNLFDWSTSNSNSTTTANRRTHLTD